MNILLVTEYFPQTKQPKFLGGVQARTFFVKKYLNRKHNIKVISLNLGKIEASSGSIPGRFLFFIKTITSNPIPKPDIIEASNVSTYVSAFLLARRLKVPVVAWIPDILQQSWKKHFPFLVAISGMAIEKFSIKLPWDRIIAMSNTTKDKLIEEGVKENIIDVVYGGVEYDKIRNIKVTKFKKPTICSIARLVVYKRINDLIDAVKIVKNDIPQIRCLIIGEGPELLNLKSKILDLGLTSNVKLVGNFPHEKTSEILKKSHLFSLPSVVEGFGIVTVEAMAAGVPYVNADIPATVEITNKGRGGLLFEAKNPKDLADKAITLLTDKKLYRNKQVEAEKLAKKFDWSIIAQQTEKNYKELI